ncbi:MAG: transglutaminase-like domain-containing protein [Bacteroidota bacterium]
MKYTLILAIAIIALVSCKHQVPSGVETVLDSAKTNRAELEKVISHYRELGDTTKLAATYFLIENMEGQCYSITKIVDTLGNNVDFDVLNYPDYSTMVAGWDSVENKIGAIDFKRDTLIYDVNNISSAYLIENIDLAFEAWEKPWAKQLTFNQFCEYVLPYRSSNEPIESWRRQLYERYQWIEDSMTDVTNPTEACALINSELTSWYVFDPRFYRHPTDLGLSEMFEFKKGRCEDMTNLAIYAMRAQGVPVMSDYTPAWPNTGNNHAWNATLTKYNRIVIFMGGQTNPYDYKLTNKKAKVYRKTFGQQKNSLSMTAPEYEKLPGWLRSSHYIDVTKDYIQVTDVKLQLQREKPDSVSYAYLYVFNSGDWKAMHWGKIKGDSVTFTDMGQDIAYLPSYFKDGENIPAGNQFILKEDGSISENIADTINTININLYSTTRKVTRKATDEIEKAHFKDGAEYELFYWNDDWIKLDSKIAIADKPLHFNDVPGNALYWLVEKDSKKEERIFTVVNGEVRWW